MSQKVLKNVASSVRQHLLNKAKAEKRPFNEILQYYAMERYLYRLSISPHADRFILKGAMMLKAWGSPELRPTMDIDMLGRTDNDEAHLASQIQEVLSVDVEPDGIVFDPKSITTEPIHEDADYIGIRLRFPGKLDTARITLQIDVGIGDVVFPGPERTVLPAILDFPAPCLLCYSKESAIAEKFETMVKLSELNSRMKDFYDIWLLSRQFDFDGGLLAEAVRLTFRNRSTDLTGLIPAFSKEFSELKQAQWTAFLKRISQDHVPREFADIISAIKGFLLPIVEAENSGATTPSRWVPPGPWR